MEFGEEKELGIDPEVRAFVFSLVSALGGSNACDDGQYVLGDDALAVLKDIKRWLRLYDDKTNRLDVARLLAEANLVKGDLLEILAGWPEDATDSSFRSKVSLLCVDLLTQLTWPIEKDETRTTMNHFLHIPHLHLAQASYKRAILHDETQKILRAVVRVCLPAMAQSRKERSPFEDNIIKVVLYLIRNIAMISEPGGTVTDEIDSDISRATTIDAFHSQDIFNLILTICSSMIEDFDTHDVEVLDILFHLVKGINVERLFMEKDDLLSSNTQALQSLISKEKGMLAGYARNAPSRHNRFGSMVWIKRDDYKYSTVLGQRAVAKENLTMVEMDKSKTWNKPRYITKRDPEQLSAEFDSTVPLTSAARRHLRSFVEQFLDSSFNPLFMAVRRAIEREADRFLEYHSCQYLYLIAWFLRAECARRQKQIIDRSQNQDTRAPDTESYGLVASVLNQETFVLLNRVMQKAQDNKTWQDLNAGMKCFTQILLTVQEMSESPLDEDQEISENILNRIFYEQTTHERIIALLRTYKDQGLGYLDACTELSHVFLRLLESYSKQNVDMQVRSRRRARKKKKVEQSIAMEGANNEDREWEVDDMVEAQRTTSERKFDFARFSSKFINQGSVDTFVTFTRHYRDLSSGQLKRAHRFFYRVAFKMDLSIYLFRLDIIALFNKLIKGPEGMDVKCATFKEWEELVQQVFRRLFRKMQERPALAVELLFSKISSTMYYLEHGYDRELPKKTYRAPAELEVRLGMDLEQQIGVAVSVLINESKSDLLAWIKGVLSSATEERKSWEDMDAARRTVDQAEVQPVDLEGEHARMTPEPDHPRTEQLDKPKAPSILIQASGAECLTAMRRDKHLRLLLTVLGFQRLGGFSNDDDDNVASPDSEYWIIPSTTTSSELSRYIDLINRFEFDPPVYEDGKSAADFVRRKPTVRDQRNSGLDSDDGEGISDIEGLFPAGGPTVRRSSHSPDAANPKRKRNRHAPDGVLDESVLEGRREARSQLEKEKRGKVKSALFVRDSDDESDEERDRVFFKEEDERRRRLGGSLMRAMKEAREEGLEEERMVNQGRKAAGAGRGEKRKAEVAADGDSDGEEHAQQRTVLKRRRGTSDRDMSIEGVDESGRLASTDDDEISSDTPPDSEADTETDTPLSSQSRGEPFERRTSSELDVGGRGKHVRLVDDEDADVSDGPVTDSDKENASVVAGAGAAVVKRRGVRAGFIIDSDSDE